MTTETVLSTEDMLLVMELAGWAYTPETPVSFAQIRNADEDSLQATYKLSYNEHERRACRSDAVNVRQLFNEFVVRQEAGNG